MSASHGTPENKASQNDEQESWEKKWKTKPPEDYNCLIGFDIMDDPVTTPNGDTYDRTAITKWITENKTDPITREALTVAQLRPNRAIKNLIEAWKHENKKDDISSAPRPTESKTEQKAQPVPPPAPAVAPTLAPNPVPPASPRPQTLFDLMLADCKPAEQTTEQTSLPVFTLPQLPDALVQLTDREWTHLFKQDPTLLARCAQVYFAQEHSLQENASLFLRILSLTQDKYRFNQIMRHDLGQENVQRFFYDLLRYNRENSNPMIVNNFSPDNLEILLKMLNTTIRDSIKSKEDLQTIRSTFQNSFSYDCSIYLFNKIEPTLLCEWFDLNLQDSPENISRNAYYKSSGASTIKSEMKRTDHRFGALKNLLDYLTILDDKSAQDYLNNQSNLFIIPKDNRDKIEDHVLQKMQAVFSQLNKMSLLKVQLFFDHIIDILNLPTLITHIREYNRKQYEFSDCIKVFEFFSDKDKNNVLLKALPLKQVYEDTLLKDLHNLKLLLIGGASIDHLPEEARPNVSDFLWQLLCELKQEKIIRMIQTLGELEMLFQLAYSSKKCMHYLENTLNKTTLAQVLNDALPMSNGIDDRQKDALGKKVSRILSHPLLANVIKQLRLDYIVQTLLPHAQRNFIYLLPHEELSDFLLQGKSFEHGCNNALTRISQYTGQSSCFAWLLGMTRLYKTHAEQEHDIKFFKNWREKALCRRLDAADALIRSLLTNKSLQYLTQLVKQYDALNKGQLGDIYEHVISQTKLDCEEKSQREFKR